MGFTDVKVIVQNPAKKEKKGEMDLLVDTGAIISVIPRKMLEDLGIVSLGKREFRVFGGQLIEREVGVAIIRYEESFAGVTVAFGEEFDTPVLGATTLETLGYEVDPVTKMLKRVELLLV